MRPTKFKVQSSVKPRGKTEERRFVLVVDARPPHFWSDCQQTFGWTHRTQLFRTNIRIAPEN